MKHRLLKPHFKKIRVTGKYIWAAYHNRVGTGHYIPPIVVRPTLAKAIDAYFRHVRRVP